MDITARIYKNNGSNSVLGYGSICIDNAFVVDGIRVVNGKNGKFVSMPSRQKQDGSYVDVAYPITKELREGITRVVLEAYDKATTANFTQTPNDGFAGLNQ